MWVVMVLDFFDPYSILSGVLGFTTVKYAYEQSLKNRMLLITNLNFFEEL